MVGPLDILFVLLIAGLGVMGWRSGLIHESATLVGFAVGLFVAGHYYRQFAPMFEGWTDSQTMADLAAFAAVLVVTWIVVLIAGVFLREFLRGLRLGWLDNLGGMLLGIVKAAFMAEIIVIVLMAVPGEGGRNAVQQSFLGRQLAALGPEVVRLVPAVLRYWKPL